MIRKAEISDLKNIQNLVEELEEQVFDSKIFADIFSENFSNSRIHYFVLISKDNIIGFMSLYESFPLHHCDKIIEVNELIVKKEYRSQNFGKQFMDFAKAFALENNCRQIELSSNMRRLKAHSFYLRNGFKRGHFKFVSKL
ncbi:GNAT family N-acetyltransferase [Lacihabitans sp. LS3-19]|uniref:GNAT family N-acetyltransferase n=1 Tax=Lacihabitans sp. LS3-19 TaxID=2487335 RepID=UPI0020CC7894|nr:GNAT family N-acetyltransferase [Lacihabitans sp. LS3-19]MCP9770346.1 GNAT family N-acetyltransferase [Lacihabitans sp. LS3-19]